MSACQRLANQSDKRVFSFGGVMTSDKDLALEFFAAGIRLTEVCEPAAEFDLTAELLAQKQQRLDYYAEMDIVAESRVNKLLDEAFNAGCDNYDANMAFLAQ